MKFGETFTEYLHGEQESSLQKYSYVEYKRLKKLLKSCRLCRSSIEESEESEDLDLDHENTVEPRVNAKDHEISKFCSCGNRCPSCDEMFFAELSREASEISGCFGSRVRRLLHDSSGGLQGYMWRLRHCFIDDQQILIQEGTMLFDYVTMNAIAIRKILKKYDKVHGSVNGRDFKTKMHAKHIELLQSPWLIELGAFYVNFTGSAMGEPGEFFRKFSCDLSGSQPVMTMTFSESIKYEYCLTCAVCLETVFNPYALSCGHLFCKSCACSAASVLLFQGLKVAARGAKCPVCRSIGVFGKAVHMQELDLLLKNRCKDYWKERLRGERAAMVKQIKDYWESQKMTALGF